MGLNEVALSGLEKDINNKNFLTMQTKTVMNN